jgi:hypothetical protein
MKTDIGMPAGSIKNSALFKSIKSRNILRYPEPSFTIDKQMYDSNREFIKFVRIECAKQLYQLTVEEFDKLRECYNYGNGTGYMIPIAKWHKVSQQERLI